MKNGDLSNRCAGSIAFRVDGFLIDIHNESTKDKLINIFNPSHKYTFNEEVLKAIKYVYRSTDISPCLVVDSTQYNNTIKQMLEDLPVGILYQVSKPVQISVHLNTGEYMYYVDDDLSRISQISNSGCITFDTFDQLFR